MLELAWVIWDPTSEVTFRLKPRLRWGDRVEPEKGAGTHSARRGCDGRRGGTFGSEDPCGRSFMTSRGGAPEEVGDRLSVEGESKDASSFGSWVSGLPFAELRKGIEEMVAVWG